MADCVIYSQKEVSRRCMSRGLAKLYRRIEELERQLDGERRRADRYKNRHQRAVRKSTPTQLTPRSKTRRLLRYMSVSSDVRKTVLFHNVVVQNLHQKYASLKSRAARRKFQNLFIGRTVRKYKMLSLCRSVLGFSGRNSGRCMKPKLVRHKSDFCVKLKTQIQQFYVRDDVSRNTAGRKKLSHEISSKCRNDLLWTHWKICTGNFCQKTQT